MTIITRTQHIQLQNKQTNNCTTETIELALFKSQTKVKTPTNHNRSKKRNEPIRIPNYYLKSTGKCGKYRGYKVRLVLVLFPIKLAEKLPLDF